MTLFKEIKRRVRNVVLAAKGEPWGGDLQPPRLELNRQPVKIETFAATRKIGHVFDEFTIRGAVEMIIAHNRKLLAFEIAEKPLAEGYFKEDISHEPDELGLRGYTLRLRLTALRPEEEAEK